MIAHTFTTKDFTSFDSFYYNKYLKDVLKPGLFGVMCKCTTLKNFPYFQIKSDIRDYLKRTFIPFYITETGNIIYMTGSWDNITMFDEVLIRPEEYKPENEKIILHLFKDCNCFNDVLDKLVDCYRYTDAMNKFCCYSNPLIPRLMSKEAIEKELGYKIIISDE